MNTIESIIDKNLKELAKQLSKHDYDKLSTNLSKQITTIFPHEIEEALSPEERIKSSISHIRDAKLYDVLEIVLHNQIRHIQNEADYKGGCLACQYENVERGCKFQFPIVISIFEKIYPMISEWIGVQPMNAPVSLTKLLRYSQTAESEGKKVMTLNKSEIATEAGSRKLEARWAIEAVQDVKVLHEVDIYNEMVSALADEIGHEIMSEIVGDLRALGGTTDESGKHVPPVLNITHISQLGERIKQAAKNIFHKTRRGYGNFAIVSPLGVTLLQSDSGTRLNPTKVAAKVIPSAGYLSYCGELELDNDVSISIFCDVIDADDNVVVGYKGENHMDVGYVWGPFTSLMSHTVVDPHTFEPVICFMTRYGKVTTDADDAEKLGSSRNYFESFAIKVDDFATIL